MDKKVLKHSLFDGFEPVSTQQWEQQIMLDMKGADYAKNLIWRTLDGFQVSPYYRSEHIKDKSFLDCNPNEFPFVRGNKIKNNNWEIRQDFVAKDPKETNTSIKNALQKGATSIGVKFCKKDIDTREKFLGIIEGIDLENVPVHFRSGKGTPEFIHYLAVELAKKGIVKKARGSFSYGPLGHLTCKGAFYENEDKDFKNLSEILQKAQSKYPGFKVIGVNGAHFGNAGASPSQELAYTLSMANDYLAKLSGEGISVDTISGAMHFTFSIGSNYFLEIARFRAARLLWSAIVSQYKPVDEKSAGMYLHAETQSYNKTVYDPYVNMLRSTTEAMSAILGGVDSLSVLPFDHVFSDHNEFSGRVARNIQIILKEEAYFDKIIDPSAGSYYIENLTEGIAQKAWGLFQGIEEKGGYLEAFRKGVIQQNITEMAGKRKDNIDTRREILLGINQYPDRQEKIASQVTLQKIKGTGTAAREIIANPINITRAAMQFEQLRWRAEKHLVTPKVFLFTIGHPVMGKARAGFSAGFFACAGYEVIDNNGFKNIEEGIRESNKRKPQIVVICSSDDEYASLVPEIKRKLTNNEIVVVAGAPACMDELKSRGIEHFIHAKSNVLKTLEHFHQLLSIK